MRFFTAQTVRTLLAALLLAGYGLFWALWSLHPIFAHNHEHEITDCKHESKQVHLHDERYAHHECPICHFLPAQASVPCLLDFEELTFVSEPRFQSDDPLEPSFSFPLYSFLRGPPSAGYRLL